MPRNCGYIREVITLVVVVTKNMAILEIRKKKDTREGGLLRVAIREGPRSKVKAIKRGSKVKAIKRGSKVKAIKRGSN